MAELWTVNLVNDYESWYLQATGQVSAVAYLNLEEALDMLGANREEVIIAALAHIYQLNNYCSAESKVFYGAITWNINNPASFEYVAEAAKMAVLMTVNLVNEHESWYVQAAEQVSEVALLSLEKMLDMHKSDREDVIKAALGHVYKKNNNSSTENTVVYGAVTWNININKAGSSDAPKINNAENGQSSQSTSDNDAGAEEKKA